MFVDSELVLMIHKQTTGKDNFSKIITVLVYLILFSVWKFETYVSDFRNLIF